MCHVLIIEDEPLTAIVLQDLLEEQGATSVSFAATEEEAVQSALACPPAVITSDVKLIEGTGPDAVRKIHAALGDVPVIFITGTPEDCRPTQPAGSVLTKPIDQRAIAAAFRALVRG